MTSSSAWSSVRIALAVLVIVLGSLLTANPVTAKATAQCSAGVKIAAADSPATVTVSGTPVVVTITGTGFAITPADGVSTLNDASWCLKASTSTQNGSGTSGSSAVINKKNKIQAISYVVVYDVEEEANDPSCWDSSVAGVGDIRYLGPPDTKDNALGYFSTDGTCSSDTSVRLMVVQAPDYDAALATCQIAYPGIQVIPEVTLNELGYSDAPANSWGCTQEGGN